MKSILRWNRQWYAANVLTGVAVLGLAGASSARAQQASDDGKAAQQQTVVVVSSGDENAEKIIEKVRDGIKDLPKEQQEKILKQVDQAIAGVLSAKVAKVVGDAVTQFSCISCFDINKFLIHKNSSYFKERRI